MTHADVASTHAVERYLLGEISSGERDEFEAHAFDCLVCAEDLKTTAIFLDTSRSVLREDHSPPAFTRAPATPAAPERGWRAWLKPSAAFPSYVLASAMLMLLGFTMYQNVVTIPALRNSSAPRALSAFSFVSSGTRGATPMVIAAPPQQPFLLFFDIPPGGRFASYHCTIAAEDGTPQLVVDVSASQARDTVQLFVPARQLRPGRHELVITGRDEEIGAEKPTQEVARYPFVLQGR